MACPRDRSNFSCQLSHLAKYRQFDHCAIRRRAILERRFWSRMALNLSSVHPQPIWNRVARLQSGSVVGKRDCGSDHRLRWDVGRVQSLDSLRTSTTMEHSGNFRIHGSSYRYFLLVLLGNGNILPVSHGCGLLYSMGQIDSAWSNNRGNCGSVTADAIQTHSATLGLAWNRSQTHSRETKLGRELWSSRFPASVILVPHTVR